MKKFIIRDALMYGWEVFKKDLGFIIAVFAIMFGLNVAFSFISPVYYNFENPSSMEMNWTMFAIILILLGISVIIDAGITKIALNYTYNEQSNIGDLFSNARFAPRIFLAGIIYAIVVFAGIILLVVPGIILAIKLSQFKFFIVDKDMGIIDSFKLSWEVTKDAKLDLFLYGLALVGLSILAIIPLFLGFIVLVPVTWLAQAFIYRELVRNTPELENLIEYENI